MADVNKLIREKIKLYDLDDFMKSVRVIQRDVFKESIDFYIAELNKLEGGKLSVAEKSNLAATAVNRYEKRITDAIAKSSGYQSEIRNYLKSFGTLDKLNIKIHSLENGIKINSIIIAANKNQRELIGKTAKGVVGEISDKSLTNNLTGQGMRDQFTKPVKRMIYQNLMTGTPGSELKTQLHDYIVGRKGEIGQLERWSGQITRDALSQYDGAINDMVREEFDLNAYRYVGSLVKDSRPQCERWVREKGGILMYDELEKEISWAKNNGQGMIPGTNKDNFGTYRGGYNCRHSAIPTTAEKKLGEPEFIEAKTIKEAEEYGKNFANNVDYSKLSVEEANVVNKTLNKVHTGSKLNKISIVDRITGIKGDANGQYFRDTNEIKISKSATKIKLTKQEKYKRSKKYITDRRKQFELDLKDDPNNTWLKSKVNNLRMLEEEWSLPSISGGELEKVIIHEYGHKIDHLNKLSINWKSRRASNFRLGEAEEWASEVYIKQNMIPTPKGMTQKDFIMKTISEYSGTNKHEFFAEAYAMKQSGMSIPKWLDNIVEKIIENGM